MRMYQAFVHLCAFSFNSRGDDEIQILIDP